MDDKSTIMIFIKALQAGDLYKSLRRKAPVNYVAMMAKVDSYAKVKEINQLKRREEEGVNKKLQIEDVPK